MKVLIVESEFLHQDTWVGNAVERLADALSQQNVTVIKSTSFDDGYAILSANEAIDCLMFSYQMEQPDEHLSVRQLIGKLHERQQNVPVFLLGDREKATASLDRDLLELVDEFAWILEDTADFIAGRAVAAMTRYRQQLLPPLFNALMKYSDIHEYSWAAPGHQGGVGFTKTPAGRFYHDYYGENLFRSDMGIERTTLGSLLDHTGAFGESEKNAARVFGADRSWSVVVGTSGSNRTIMQACMTDNDVVVLDRNCHKSIEQGLILTGAKPVYMVPSRNRYGIIGPIYPQEMQPETLQKKISASPLTKTKAGQKPSYSVVTNCTYDGVCYNAKEAQDLLAKTSDRIHFDEAWYGYARFNPIYCDHYAMRGEPGDHNGPTVFATHSTHKLLNALSQASYIHVREGRGAVNFSRFNQAYMMHATTSPLYAICASNDVAVSMMDGNSGQSLTQEVIDEAVDFRQAMARLYKEFTDEGDWFFKPWNKDVVTDPQTGKTYDFADAPAKLLATDQNCWVMRPGETWHGFKDLPDNWSMLDPIKVSILAPGMGDDGELEASGVPAALVTAWLGRHGIVPTRTTDFQIMFLFSMGVTRGKWGTLINTLCSFKHHYDANTPLAQVMPELVQDYPDTYANMGIHDLGDKMFAWLRENNPGARLNAAYSTLPVAEITPRDAYNAIVNNNIEMVAIENLPGRIAANSVIPYPPGIPMLLSGENFGDENSPQVGYLRSLQSWDHHFPGFEHETEGTEIIDGVYHVMCVKA
ncbi:arginine decarboxylase [Salmonella enterica subsp. enterica serovar Beaudesert]|nr:arginine decarboxylase [Salmonella enterica]ECF2428782.1 arginine decarboxylase [Salmonella enterica subsp. enterica serovar Beaudesert]EAY5153095.1 arginine decarboxylase [Salmonella enterica]EAZ4583687.1 arginine decarboxylase [Salmonella enterica]EBK4144742.1 arginine decarboxylase [Salmonella enterica]